MAAASIAPFWLAPGEWGAQKITVNMSLAQQPATVSGVSATVRALGAQAISTNFALYFQGLQSIATGSKTAVQTGSVTPLGYCWLHNTDETNYVSIYSDASGSTELMRLFPGDQALFPLGPASTLYAEANGAACALEIYTTAR